MTSVGSSARALRYSGYDPAYLFPRFLEMLRGRNRRRKGGRPRDGVEMHLLHFSREDLARLEF